LCLEVYTREGPRELQRGGEREVSGEARRSRSDDGRIS
jgi:hypothetical protein